MKIVSPPKYGCECHVCKRRRAELELAEKLEAELHRTWREIDLCRRAA